MARGVPSAHTRTMSYAFAKIADLAPVPLLSVPIVIASLVLVALVWTGIAGRIAVRFEDMRSGRRVRASSDLG